MNTEDLLRVAEISKKWMELEITDEESLRIVVASLSEMENHHDFAQHIQSAILNRYLDKPAFSVRELDALFEVLSTFDHDEDVAFSTLSGLIAHPCLSLKNIHYLIESGIGEKYSISKKLDRQLFLTRLALFEKELLDVTSNGDPVAQTALLAFLEEGVQTIAEGLMVNGSNKKIRNLSKALHLSLKKKA